MISFLDGKIPCVQSNETEQLSILISTSKEKLNWESVWTRMKPPTMKSTIQTKLEFDSSDVPPMKTEVTEETSDKIPSSFSQSYRCKNRKKKSKHSNHKNARKTRRQREYSNLLW